MGKIRVAATGDDKLDLRRLIEDQGDLEDVDLHGILSFLDSGAFRLGVVWVKDNANVTVLSSAVDKQQFIHFANNGPSRGGVEPDHTNDHLTIPKDGIYLVLCILTVENNAVQSHVVDMSVWKNNGSEELEAIHAHRSLTGGSGDIGSVTIGSFVELSAQDTLEFWLDTDAAAVRSVTISDCGLLAIQLAAA